ncbi:MAG: flagellar basal-body MS-ring/collar protein FliF [Pseudomonadota bacterium]
MNALTGIWVEMEPRRRAFLVGSAAALLVILVILTRVVTAPSYALLYSGLDAGAAGDVIAAIEARGIAYTVQGDAIHVDTRNRDALRMSLAGEGLPANGAAGYELLDTLSGFGTTSQMFDAAYWRAKEGELARTITTSPHIRAARVHLANPSSDPFQPVQEVTASVAIRPASGGLAPGHGQALRYLVASSVPGLLPENVTILDADSGQVLGGHDAMSPLADAAGRAETYRRNVERLLSARVGPGNAVVQVSVELNTARETILERTIDPDSRVVVETETEDRNDSAQDADAAGVTVASNLADGDAAAGGGQSTSQTSESRERVTFDLSEMQREIETQPGGIRRITVAVLVNGVTEVGADGIEVQSPRSTEEIDALRSLVQSAIGFDADRGDTITIESMVFDDAVASELSPPTFTDRVSLDLGRVIQTLVLAAAALFIAFGILRPLFARTPQLTLDDSEPRLALPGDTTSIVTSVDPVTNADLPPLEPNFTLQASSAGEFETDTNLPSLSDELEPSSTETDPAVENFFPAGGIRELPHFDPELDLTDPVSRLRRMIEEREDETMEILRSWMEEEEPS